MKPEISVCLAAYNEADVIQKVLGDWWRYLRQLGRSFELIVIDNASTDQTPFLVEQFARRHEKTRWVRNPANLGYSGSCRVAVQKATGRWVLFVDGDGQYVASDADLFLLALNKGADLVLGRRIKRMDHFLRKITSGIFRISFGVLSGQWASDPNCGFRAWRRGVRIFGLLQDHLPFANPQIICGCLDTDRTLAEVPILHRIRTSGQSFYHLTHLPMIYAKFLRFVLVWRLARICRGHAKHFL